METGGCKGFITSRGQHRSGSLGQKLKTEAGDSSSPLRLFWVLVGFAENPYCNLRERNLPLIPERLAFQLGGHISTTVTVVWVLQGQGSQGWGSREADIMEEGGLSHPGRKRMIFKSDSDKREGRKRVWRSCLGCCCRLCSGAALSGVGSRVWLRGMTSEGRGPGCVDRAAATVQVSLPLGPSSPRSVDGVPPVLPDAEETVSVSSCFASEDTTEDSGVMSSPSDIISLDFQHDSMKFKDKWATDQEDCSDEDLAGTPELGPQKSPSGERNVSGNWQPRTEKAVIASNNDEDLFVTGQFQKTLAELDEDLGGMEDSYETDTSSLTSSINGVSSGCKRDAIIADSDADAIPVTFIGEVLDDPVDAGLFANRNNNAGSFDKGSVTSRGAHLLPYQAEHSQQHGKKGAEVPESSAPSQDSGKEIKSAWSNTCNVCFEASHT
ncbi:hypothetical protein HPG69_012158 [Diceros bicornis minor]|uniref:Uncharacterized protein n=1 Tax=Diceros bicornis minor TaxID=77932 RepID=A0A7J7EM20_DICBM|nr:hypothetical protein HPG69_012158 [Diceros bicornis minor]